MVCNRHGYALREPTSSKMHFFKDFEVCKHYCFLKISDYKNITIWNT